MQQTIRSAVTFSGIGLHSGAPATATILSAPANHGIRFRRADLAPGSPDIPARWDAVTESRLCTVIAGPSGVSVSTVEHLMAALAGTGIHNALVIVDGPEVPILDGSAMPFVRGLMSAGIIAQGIPVRVLRVLAPVEVREGEARARLEPASSLVIDFSIDFADAAIGRQSKQLDMANGAFVHELMDSRTFCRESDVAAMRAAGLARGGSYENAVVVSGARIISPGGLRHEDEPVRHKMLDALGDLALAGGPVLGRYVGVRAGHALTNRLLRTLFATPGAVRWEDCAPAADGRLPGAGIGPDDLAPCA